MLEEWLYPKDWKEHSINELEMEGEYGAVCDYFESILWNHYEISNWAKPGFECLHNQWYWNHTNSRGFGLSATSFLDGERWENSASFSWYYLWKLFYKESLTKDQMKLENIIHRLRTFSLPSLWFNKEKMEQLENDGLIKIRENKIVLTQAWIFRENFILSELHLEESS
jgi:oxygen-independent coproporphyrinogen III oxidase